MDATRMPIAFLEMATLLQALDSRMADIPHHETPVRWPRVSVQWTKIVRSQTLAMGNSCILVAVGHSCCSPSAPRCA